MSTTTDESNPQFKAKKLKNGKVKVFEVEVTGAYIVGDTVCPENFR